MKQLFISTLSAVLLMNGMQVALATEIAQDQYTTPLVNTVTIEDIATGKIGYASNTIDHVVKNLGLSIFQTFAPDDDLQVGDVVTITTTVRNNNNFQTATGVRISSSFYNSQISITDVVSNNCLLFHDRVTCDLGTLTPLSETTVVVKGRVNASGQIGIENTVSDLGGIQSQLLKTFNADGSYVESLRLVGNQGLAQGVEEDLYARINGIEDLDTVTDVELSLLRGAYHYVDQIPNGVQHYEIAIDDGEILKQLSASTNTAIYKIPFTIPVLQDLTDGAYTLQLAISKSDLQHGDERIVGLLPIYIGQPMPGDAQVDWDVDLVDTVVAMRFVDGISLPSDFAERATDINTDSGLQIGDVFEIFKIVFDSFWQVS